MKKAFMLLALTAAMILASNAYQPASAQELGPVTTAQYAQHADAAPGIIHSTKPQFGSPKAMWDLLFNYNITSVTNSVGCAGVCYINGDIWVSKWATDTLMRFSTGGVLIEKFQIAGLTGVRSMTTDGTFIYAGANTGTIYRINPNTKLLSPPHVTVAGNARWVTYDPTLNSNAGGFWYGNFATDITAVDMAGNVLSTIPAAQHTLTGMYGAAYDGASAGGPYLWVFDQSGTNTTQITAISLTSGTPTIYTHDAFVDISGGLSLTSALAGGLFLSTTISPGNIALIGVVQGTPNNGLFAYDLDIPGATIDAGVSKLRPTAGYTQIPEKQKFAETFTFDATNNGTAQLDSVYADFEITYNGSPFYSDVLTTTNLASAGTFTFTTDPIIPTAGVGDYVVNVTLYPGSSQTDGDASNDTMSFTFQVTDSTFARDNGIPDGGSGYAVSGTDWAYAMTNFSLAVDDTLQGIWIQSANPVDGDSTYAVVAHTTAGIPDSVIATGDLVIFNSLQFEYYLEFPAPVALPAGLYSFGCYEGTTATINLAQSPDLFTNGMNFFYTPTGGWTQSGIQTARFIRPYFSMGDGSIGINEGIREKGLAVYPNPSNGIFTVSLPASSGISASVKVFETTGRLIETLTVPCSGQNATIDLSAYPEGLYFIQLQSEGINSTQKVMISR
ncbi:MAG: T9SS type A sorting domain-containing protein [Bacteroidota bacterium]